LVAALRNCGLAPARIVPGGVGVGGERAEAQAAAVEILDVVQAQEVDVDDAGRPLDILLHQVDQVGTAGEIADVFARALAHRFMQTAGADIVETVHGRSPWPSTSQTASTMFG
jgi:hypothetical protein